MSDQISASGDVEIFSPENLPPSPASEPLNDPPPENEHLGQEAIHPKNSPLEKIQSATGELFEKIGWKRGRGRPKNCPHGVAETQCEICAGKNAPDLPQSPAGNFAPPAVERDPLIVKRSVAAMAKAATRTLDRVIYQKALDVSGDKNFAKETVDATAATKDECDAIGELTDLVLKELGLDSKYVPIMAAVTVVGGMGARYFMVMRSLDKIARTKNVETVSLKDKK